jgi:hypothetical protein
VDKLVGATSEFIKKIPIAAVTKKGADFAEYVRNGFRAVKTAAGKEFEQGMEELTKANPTKMVDLGDTIKILQEEIANEPKVKTLVNRIPELKKMMGTVEDYVGGADITRKVFPQSTEVTLEQAQKLKNLVSQRISPAKYKGRISFKTEELPILDIKDNINKSILSTFPEMADVHAKYGEVINKYNELRGLIRKGSLLSNIEKNWNDPEIKNMVNQLLSPKMVQEMGGYRAAAKLLNLLKTGAGYAAVGGPAAAITYGAAKKVGLIPNDASSNYARRGAQ